MPDLKLEPPPTVHATPPPGPHQSPLGHHQSPLGHLQSPIGHLQSPLGGISPLPLGPPPSHHFMPMRLPPQHMHPDRDPVILRHTPYMGQPDFRVHELNKRLQQRPEEGDNLWWDAFATEFFEDDATMTLSFCLEDGPKRYSIGRTLIPRYFRSIFESGVNEMYYMLRHAKESFHNTTITLDCDQALMVTHHGKPMFSKVVTEGRLIFEFTFDDLMRIRTWHFAIRQHKELIPRSVIAMQQDPAMVEQLSKNITRQGHTNYTLNFLRLCEILEPMQELMSRHKMYGLPAMDCLKSTLFQKWQRMVAPPESNRTPNKRRKRKSSTGNSANNSINSTPPSSKKRSPGPQGFTPMPGDVMVVGEPTLMGGEFGDEDERLITRLENNQYENSTEDDLKPPNLSVEHMGTSQLGSPKLNSPWGTDNKHHDDPPHVKTEN